MLFEKTTLALAFAALATLAAAPAQAQTGAALAKLGPPAVTPRYNDVMTAVLYGDRAAVSQLLELGRWVDKPDSNGLTPLMAAVLGRDAEMVELLLMRGADPNRQARVSELTKRSMRTDFPTGGFTALMWAARSGDEAVVRRLVAGGRASAASGAEA